MSNSPSRKQIAQARVIAAAEKDGVDWQEIALALDLARTTYYRRRSLPAELAAARDSDETALTRTEAACR